VVIARLSPPPIRIFVGWLARKIAVYGGVTAADG
jgi:hypothetical protein